MDDRTKTHSPQDAPVEEILTLMKQQGISEAPLPSTDDLGEKGEQRFYIVGTGFDDFHLRSCEPDQPLPEGAKEITWEQACEVLVHLKLRAEYEQVLSELTEQAEQVAQQLQELAELT